MRQFGRRWDMAEATCTSEDGIAKNREYELGAYKYLTSSLLCLEMITNSKVFRSFVPLARHDTNLLLCGTFCLPFTGKNGHLQFRYRLGYGCP